MEAVSSESRIVMITGVGGGLGRAMALSFARAGWRVIGVAHREESLRDAEGSIGPEHFSGYLADVANAAEVADAVAASMENHGRIDVLFNNAAVYQKVNFLDESPADWARTMAVNVNGIANCCKSVLPHMIEAGRGRIFNVGSFADLAPIGNSAAYSASKGAVHALTKAIARDIEHLGTDIEVHEWIPGHVNTQMSGFTGLEPEIPAGWAVELASMPRARTPNCVFQNDRELLPPKRLAHRARDLVFFWR